MIDKEKLLNEFHRLHAKTNGTLYMSDIAEIINFAITYVPLLPKAFPDDRDLLWEIRSFMRRAFRNTLRITVGASHDNYLMQMADDLAKRAGFHQYKSGDVVSIFDCIEVETDGYIAEDFDFYGED